ncbi:hypothetical protein FHS31_000641 [Sphingomonas vulcanisoli]|uniref:DUF2271 domain-containing protein n=1 Tax=Sphingomonas vulcanisoli TaxID=1658060 RepID=A0ABX0TNG5_9SPHN|nr:DUF2271 domain-containing protein [Sphingomonas vulcanisoli]NIJ07059.1 hypothetical protein [Sphingomonas vulcanisoli]
MRLSPFAPSLAVLTGLAAAPTMAATVTVTIPRQSVAEYQKPYVAVYLEPTAGGPAKTVALWYAMNKPDGDHGTKWLNEVRAWWRKGGRSLSLPADGISGATRAPGTYSIPLPADALSGAYKLTIEAAREHGGREFVTIAAKAGASGSGKTELGAVAVR